MSTFHDILICTCYKLFRLNDRNEMLIDEKKEYVDKILWNKYQVGAKLNTISELAFQVLNYYLLWSVQNQKGHQFQLNLLTA